MPEDVAQNVAFWPYQLVAVPATTMLCASIILPITPPALLAAAIRTGSGRVCRAVIFCRLPKSTLEEVSRSRQRHAQPAQHGPEEGIQHAGRGEGQAHRGVQAGVARDVAERQHGGDGEQGEAARACSVFHQIFDQLLRRDSP